jgi:phospholipid/cholesterol/gamma-HCH transport system substrate-binding protein
VENRNVKTGLFVIVGLLLFAVGMFLIGDRRQAFARHREYYSDFLNLAGLASGAKVRVGGMDAGQVVDIVVPNSPSSRFRVEWRIDARLGGLVRTDSVAIIGTEGVVGDVFLSVRPGSAKAIEAPANAVIPGKEPMELSDLLARGNELLSDADKTLNTTGGKLATALDEVTTTVSNVNDVVTGLKQGRGMAGMLLRDDAFANQIRTGVTGTLSSVQDVVADLKAGRGPAGMLLRDEALAAQIRDAVENGQHATVDLAHASHQADALVADLNSRQIPQKAGEVMDNLTGATKQVRELVEEINKPDKEGFSAGANIRQSLTNANTASANLADATEALKHNFLTRGFFKKRGYYNLAELSPEQYRRERAFTDSANRRVWLAGSKLFEKNPGGGEQLSAEGKALLDASLTSNGDPAISGPVVVEGYWKGDAPTEQLRFSRDRAAIVRQYLEARFQIDPREVAAVPLKNAPPKGTGPTAWDGICLVILRKG